MNQASLPLNVPLGNFVLREVIGVGGMGIVYRAYHTLDRQDVAIKFMTTSIDDERAIRYFHREAENLSHLQHPNIVGFAHRGDLEHQGQKYPYLAMEYLPHLKTLDVAFSEAQNLDWLLDRVEELLEALDYMHRRPSPVVHRDLKPANLGVPTDGRLRVLDLGLSRTTMDTRLTRTGMALGTLIYTAPEQLDDARTVDARADLYSVGMILTMLLGGNPFENLVTLQVYRAIVNGSIPPCPRPRPPEMVPFIDALLCPQPELRCQTASDALDRLRTLRRRLQRDRVSTRGGGDVPLFGRSTVLRDLTDRLRHAVNGRGCAVLILGPRLIGKSRLLQELAGLCAGLDARAVWAESAQTLAETLGCKPLPAELLTTLSVAAEEDPILLCLDGEDPALLSLLEMAIRKVRGERLMIVASAEHKPEKCENLVAHELGELDDEAARDTLEAMLGVAAVGSNLFALVKGAVGGNPGLLQDAARWLREEGRLHLSPDGVAEAPGVSDVRLSDAALEALGERFQHLSPESMETLSVAGLIGSEFSEQTLMAVVEKPVDLSAFAPFVQPMGDGRWRFIPGKLADAAAFRLESSVRRGWHLKVADWLEQDDDRRTEALPEVVRHLGASSIDASRAGRVREGRALVQAGKRAYETGEFSRAHDWLTRSVELLRDTDERYLSALGMSFLGASMVNTHGAGMGKVHAERAAVIAEDLPPAEWLEVGCMAVKTLLKAGELVRARELLDRLVVHAGAEASEWTVRMHLHRAFLGRLDGSLISREDALESANTALNLSRCLAPRFPRFRLAALVEMGALLSEGGRYEEAEDTFLQALDAATTLGDKAIVLTALGVVNAFNLETFDKAESFYREALQIVENTDHHTPDTLVALPNLIVLLGWQGRFAEAETFLARTQNQAVTELRLAPRVAIQMGELRMQAWRYEEARTLLERSAELSDGTYPDLYSNSHSYLGLIAVSQGDVINARTHLETALKSASKTEESHYLWDVHFGLATLELAEGNLEAVEAALKAMQTLRRGTLRPIWREAMRCGLAARLSARRGNWDAFLKDMGRACRTHQELNTRPDLVQLHVDVAKDALSLSPPPRVQEFIHDGLRQAAGLAEVMEWPQAHPHIEALVLALPG